ncbi:APA family basic amino acid/polyamine antiporter [Sphingomonas naasensis]|uniref:Amino acid permease n=1 Tax=Sphingomonas naasensis TaxID=1344951 RepID=A0A4S1WHC6_9SPHN|nr:amino acid permease [Sphingomonas naasensis]NIJ21786.1 APA family basic amino acid/polyamine antiporter [Sphingomonas naasensis]TGX42511.1 amino acid permease [Sphingomonas naasensis]
MASLFRLKRIVAEEDRPESHRLQRTLSWPHLVALGVGAIVGTGILTLIGVGADRAGPAVILSFVVAGAICACAALAYAEMATMIPASGSAYTYSYVVLGEIVAWVIGWSLLAEYTLVVGTVAVGWSGYATPFLTGMGVPGMLTHGPQMDGWQVVQWGVNVPALFVVWLVAGLLILGTRESATLNAILVVVKLIALAVFVAVALPYFNNANLEPFAPFGFAKHMSADGVERGVMAAAAIIFFAFYGFDAISTAAEEAKNPGRDLAIGIVGSMVVCVAIYMIVAIAAVGALHYSRFADSPEPLALILREIGRPGVAAFLAGSAIIALPTVILAFLYGQSRIFFVMARDHLLPAELATVSRRGTPVRITIFTASVVSFFAAFFPIDQIAALANAGTLTAFAAVGICMLVMRRRAPDAVRPFRAPAVWLVGLGAAFGCLYLFISLPHQTQLLFGAWNLIGLLLYFGWARRNADKVAM